MSVIRPKPPEDPLEFSLAALRAASGDDATALAPSDAELERARDAAVEETLVQLPDRLLADYNGTATGRTRGTSELYAVLQEARRIRDAVDRVVVLGDAHSTQAARAVFDCCCHPFHNELSRGERGGRPRLSFVGHAADGDLLQGIVDLVAPAGALRGADLLDQWAIVLCETAPRPAVDVLLPLLLRSVGGDRARLADRVVPVASTEGGATDLATAIGCRRVFSLPDGRAGCHGPLTAAVLLPAAIAGVDVVRLLQGAAAMNTRFREAAAVLNPVLQLAAAARLAARRDAATPRLCSADAERLQGLVRWHDQLRAPTAGAAAPTRPAAIVRLLAGEPRRDPLSAVPPGPSAAAAEGLDQILCRRDGPLAAPAAAAEPPPTAPFIRLPRIDEHAIGQLLQLLLLATAVDARLAG